MTSYISLLRGINVSGKNIIKMDALKKLMGMLGFSDVTTYVQSGNIVFKSDIAEPKRIESIIQTGILNEFGLSVPVLVLTKQELKSCIDNNPLNNGREESFLHYTFLSEEPDLNNLDKLQSKKGENEELVLGNRVVYLYCPNGYGNTKLSNTFIENSLKVSATTRNFKTTKELYRIAENI